MGMGWGVNQRSVRIGEYLYALGGMKMKVVKLSDPDEVVADMNLIAEVTSGT
jgi:hypothetical protein